MRSQPRYRRSGSSGGSWRVLAVLVLAAGIGWLVYATTQGAGSAPAGGDGPVAAPPGHVPTMDDIRAARGQVSDDIAAAVDVDNSVKLPEPIPPWGWELIGHTTAVKFHPASGWLSAAEKHVMAGKPDLAAWAWENAQTGFREARNRLAEAQRIAAEHGARMTR